MSILGLRFSDRRRRGTRELIATHHGVRITIAEATGSFFSGWSWSTSDAETGRPIDSSIGRDYFPTPADALAASGAR